jgi:PAS domain S-box-containing protein
MAAGKKKQKEMNPDTPPGERSLRDSAEKQLVHSPKHSPELKGKTSEQFIYELQVHQIELETQAEELRRTHLALEESRDKFLDLYDFAPTGYITLTDKVLIAEVNLAGATLLGVERRKLVNTRFRKFIAPEFFEQWDQYFVNVLNRGEKQTCTLTLKRSDGSTVPARMEGIRLTGSDGAITVRVAVSDITDIWQIEALRESENRLGFAFGVSEIGAWDLDLVHHTAWRSLRHDQIFGYGSLLPEWTYEMFLDHILPEDRPLVNQKFNKAISEKHDWEFECRIRRIDGEIRWIWARGKSQYNAQGESIRMLGLVQDITGRKAAEEALRVSEEKFRGIFDTINDGIHIHEIEPDGKPGKFIELNEVACRMLQYTREELLEHGPLDIVSGYHSRPLPEIIGELSSIGHSIFETEHRKKDGTIVPVEINAHVVSFLGKRMTISVVRDITERKRAEKALKETTDYLQNLLNYANAPIIVWDPSLRITRFNHAFERLTGRTSIEVLGQPLEILFPPKSREPSLELIKKTMSGERWETVDIPILHVNGSIRTVLWNSATLLADDQKTVVATIAQGYDITERKIAEDALRRINQKLNVITNLTRQDLTNQLFVLKSYLEITKKNAAGQERILEGIQKCEKAILSINEITEFTKDFQNMGAKPPKWQNVKLTLLLGLSHISIGKIQHSLETENLEIFADPLLEKVCQRLFENSVKHGDHVTRIRVWHTATLDGAMIFFEDNGVGILPEMKEQIFLRGEGPRASMRSLFFVREILDITGISIKETGEPGKGARFEMVVPKGMWRDTLGKDAY